jgi:hypothetical protein
MTTLHLGVLDVPYGTGGVERQVNFATRKSGVVKFTATPEDRSTGEVAEYLEKKYRVMGNFFDAHKADIVGVLEETIGDSLESLLMGAPAQSNSMAAASSQIETLFHRFISNAEMETGEFVGGVPTLAALRGVNHRLADPYAEGNPRRPSFKDTGLYDASFKAWID